MSGVCAAVAAARKGVKTALIQNRPILGGNAEYDIGWSARHHHMSRPDARETGILEEILLENKRRNPTMNYPIFDTVLWETVHFQENLSLYLNTHMTEVYVEGNRIQGIRAVQMTTEKVFRSREPILWTERETGPWDFWQVLYSEKEEKEKANMEKVLRLIERIRIQWEIP